MSDSASVQDLINESKDTNSCSNQDAEDESCVHKISQRLVRIQYPGNIKNLDKALETLGGLRGIERGVANNKLELNFHPRSKYSKGVTADVNYKKGLLIKVKKDEIDGKSETTIEIVGATVKNFIFTKFIDFQYLPLVAKYPEKPESDVMFVYDSILPNKLPDIKTVLGKEGANMPLFLPPVGFSRAENQKGINPVEKPRNISNVKVEAKSKNRERKLLIFAKHRQPSIYHKFHETEIPEKPTEFISELISRRNYHGYLLKLQDLFEERPIWSKNGLRYHTKLSNDLLKVLLPAVAYYELTGPWRCTWIRFGFDPRKEPESKKYQMLDYRIPYSVRTNLKIGSKRVVDIQSLPTSLNKLKIESSGSNDLENSFILRPNILPISRQVFYQYCDIYLPEIQLMLSRLPPTAPDTQCDPKIGWFPSSFVDQCREIVSRYIDKQAAHVLRKQRESLPPSGLEAFLSPIRSIESKMKTEAGVTNDEDDEILTIYDSDSDDSTGYEQFYQDNNLFALVENLDDTVLSCEKEIAELYQLMKK